MSADPVFAPRVRRLALISLVALGVIWGLAVWSLHTPAYLGAALAAGRFLMPTLLWLSLRQPIWRYGLALPSALVGVPLLIVCAMAPPEDEIKRVGVLLLTAGIWMGGVLGAWFWFRWLPVPEKFEQPFSTLRWRAIGVHVALIMAGGGLLAVRVAV
jgi:hypothetical protein